LHSRGERVAFGKKVRPRLEKSLGKKKKGGVPLMRSQKEEGVPKGGTFKKKG